MGTHCDNVHVISKCATTMMYYMSDLMRFPAVGGGVPSSFKII